ncbi:MAG: LAGLIDADG family homing endonuclease [Candidatus Hadarchaeota archaeon]
MNVDIAQIAPRKTSIGRDVDVVFDSAKVTMFVPASNKWGGGKESKKVTVNRFIPVDDLFMEGLGLWRGEGGKKKGIYFGNSDVLLRKFLDFCEQRLGLQRTNFKVTLNVPKQKDEETVKLWSAKLHVPQDNFTKICVDSRTNFEYAQVYFNSIILADLMNCIYLHLKPVVSKSPEACVPFLRGLFAAEGSVLLKQSGVLHHITFSSKDDELIQLLCESLRLVGVNPGKYMENGMNLQIYGRRNFERIRELGIHTLHPSKREKFERGFASYKRIDVLDGEEARSLILQQLASGPKTYDELAAALGKARTTIQAHHILVLEGRGLVRRAGKRGRGWLWELAEQPIDFSVVDFSEARSLTPAIS